LAAKGLHFAAKPALIFLALEHRLGGAQLHEAFDAAMELVQVRAELAKELHGLDALELEEEEGAGFVASVAQRILKALIYASGLGHAALGLESKLYLCEWSPRGLHFTWHVWTEPCEEQFFVLDHVVRLDSRDLTQHCLHRSFVNGYHELQERLAALPNCATVADIKAGITCGPGEAGEDEVCVVCQEDMEQGEELATLTACGHRFHRGCVEKWLLGCSKDCPMCKCPVAVACTARMERRESYYSEADEGFFFAHSLDSVYSAGGGGDETFDYGVDCLGTLAETGPGEALTEGGVEGGMYDDLVSIYDTLEGEGEEEYSSTLGSSSSGGLASPYSYGGSSHSLEGSSHIEAISPTLSDDYQPGEYEFQYGSEYFEQAMDASMDDDAEAFHSPMPYRSPPAPLGHPSPGVGGATGTAI